MIREFGRALVLGTFLTLVFIGLSAVFQDRFWMQVAEAVK